MQRRPELLPILAFAALAACARTIPAPTSPVTAVSDAGPPADASPPPEAATAPVDAGSAADAGGLPPPIALTRRGVNLSGAEFGAVPGVYGRDYQWPTPAMADYFLALGMNHFRVPFMHERLQPKLQGALDPVELGRMTALVGYVTSRGATVELDAQNDYRFNGAVVTEVQIGDFWGRVAQTFKGNPLVQIDATNEPHDMPTEQVLALGNAVVREARRVGFTGLVILPGNGWAGAGHWAETFNGATPSSKVMAGIVDPGPGETAVEVHLYLDANADGTKDCASPTIGVERLAPFVAWLRANHRRGVLGEIGAIATPVCNAAVRNALAFVEANYDVILQWSWWSSGWASFGSIATYPMSVGPAKPGPQLGWLLPSVPPPACANAARAAVLDGGALDGGAP